MQIQIQINRYRDIDREIDRKRERQIDRDRYADLDE